MIASLQTSPSSEYEQSTTLINSNYISHVSYWPVEGTRIHTSSSIYSTELSVQEVLELFPDSRWIKLTRNLGDPKYEDVYVRVNSIVAVTSNRDHTTLKTVHGYVFVDEPVEEIGTLISQISGDPL